MTRGEAAEGLLRRLQACAGAYLLSTVAASLGVLLGLVAWMQADGMTLDERLRLPITVIDLLVKAGPSVLLATIALTIVPASLFILAAELARLRHWSPYVSFGTALGPAVAIWFASAALLHGPDWIMLVIAAGSGAFAGLTYWHVAIRLRPPPPRPAGARQFLPE
jgi:hypothetical protein